MSLKDFLELDSPWAEATVFGVAVFSTIWVL